MRNDLSLHLLEQFVALARTRNFTRAAEELHLSQPALSRAIQKLEDQLGQPLFERKPREVVLTDLGERLLERAKAILQVMDDTFAELSEAGRRARIRVGAIPTIAPYFLPHLLGGFAREHPDVHAVVQEDTTDVLIKRCRHGELDVAILALPIAARDLEVEPLFDEELLLVLPAGHPLAAARSVDLTAVETFPFVLLNEVHCLSESIASFCRSRSVHPVTIERTSQLTTILELVALGHGISMVPAMARELDASDQRVYRSFRGDKPQRTVAMLWNPQRFQNKAVKAFMDHLRHSTRPATRAANRAANRRGP